MDESTLLVSLMHANNETGAVSDVARLASVAKDQGALFHTDSVQTFPGAWRVEETGADLVSVSAHKFGGPTGVGALYVRGGTPIEPLVRGGGQERDLRAGTEPMAAIVGMAAALAVPRQEEPVRAARDLFLSRLVEAGFVPTVLGVNIVDGETAQVEESLGTVLPGHAHGRFPGVSAESMLIRLDRLGVSASSGSACSSGSLEPSHVALAMGWSQGEAREALRFTFGRGATLALAEEAARRTIQARDEILAAGRA
jgi:cysteine desulfurase